MRKRRIKVHGDLEVYQMAFQAAMVGRELYTTYDHILGKLVNMILRPDQWLIPPRESSTG